MFMNVTFYIKSNARVLFVLSWTKEHISSTHTSNPKIKGATLFVLDFTKEYEQTIFKDNGKLVFFTIVGYTTGNSEKKNINRSIFV